VQAVIAALKPTFVDQPPGPVDKENAYELTAELPGMDESNVELKVVGGVLTVKGEKKDEREERAGTTWRRFGSIQCSIPLPEGVDLDRTEATFKKGLTVTMPKMPEAQKSARKIAIKAG
jgi:HSP20 family protein